jgi:hypothetical protein
VRDPVEAERHDRTRKGKRWLTHQLTGDLTTSKANGNDTAGRTVAEAGQNWAATHWRDEDTTAYTFRLYLELARVWSGGDPLGGYVYDAKAEVQV